MATERAASSLGTAPGSYLYSLAIGADEQTYATIASDDSLTLFDAALRPRGRYQAAHRGIRALTTFGSGFATAGSDGRVRCWDVRAARGTLELVSPRPGSGLSALTTRDNFLAAGTESTKEGLADMDVLLFDARQPATPLRVYSESHTDSITQLAFHPTRPDRLLSASDDGLVSLFDLTQSDEDDAVLRVLNPRGGVHCAGFLPVSSATQNEDAVYVLTADERFLSYTLSSETGAVDESSSLLFDFGDVRPQLDCAYVIDLLPWTSSPLLAAGNHAKRNLQLVQLDPTRGFAFGSLLDFPGAHGEEVVRDVLVREAERRVWSCGEDGLVKVWQLAG